MDLVNLAEELVLKVTDGFDIEHVKHLVYKREEEGQLKV